jgi:hypothetical protein
VLINAGADIEASGGRSVAAHRWTMRWDTVNGIEASRGANKGHDTRLVLIAAPAIGNRYCKLAGV